MAKSILGILPSFVNRKFLQQPHYRIHFQRTITAKFSAVTAFFGCIFGGGRCYEN